MLDWFALNYHAMALVFRLDCIAAQSVTCYCIGCQSHNPARRGERPGSNFCFTMQYSLRTGLIAWLVATLHVLDSCALGRQNPFVGQMWMGEKPPWWTLTGKCTSAVNSPVPNDLPISVLLSPPMWSSARCVSLDWFRRSACGLTHIYTCTRAHAMQAMESR